MMDKCLRFIQLSDLHLFGNSENVLLGVNTRESFEKTFEKLLSDDFNYDFLFLSGDLSHDGSNESYQYLADKFKLLKQPVFAIPGNHDQLETFQSQLKDSSIHYQPIIKVKDWLLICLSSHKPGAVYGYLDRSQLEILEDTLQENQNMKTIIFFHHHPVSMKTAWLDQSMLVNAQVFWETIHSFKQIKAVIFGHVHQAFEGLHDSIPCYGSPSTCIQFKPQSQTFGLDFIPSGYRSFEFLEDGKILTKISRIDHYIGIFDKKATGY